MHVHTKKNESGKKLQLNMMMDTEHGTYTCLTLWKPWKKAPVQGLVELGSEFIYVHIYTYQPVSVTVQVRNVPSNNRCCYLYIYVLRCSPGWSQIHSPASMSLVYPTSMCHHHHWKLYFFLSTLQIRSFYTLHTILASCENNSELYHVVSFPVPSDIQKVVH